MVRRSWRLAALAAVAWATGCGGARPQKGAALAPGQNAAGPAVGLARYVTLGRGALGYEIEMSESGIVTVELDVDFFLVSRAASGTDRPPLRVELGVADYDITDLDVRGDRAWVSSLDGTVRQIDLTDGRTVTTWRLGAMATAVEEVGDYVLTGTDSGVLCLRRRRDSALLQCTVAHTGRLAAISARGDVALSASWDGTITAWQLPSLRRLAHRRVGGSANDVAISPDGHTLAVATSGVPPIRSPEIARREARGEVRRTSPGATISTFEIRRAGRNALRLERPIRRSGHGGPVVAVTWSADGERLASASWDRSVRLWARDAPDELAAVRGFEHLVHDVDAAPNGRWLGACVWATARRGATTELLSLLYETAAP